MRQIENNDGCHRVLLQTMYTRQKEKNHFESMYRGTNPTRSKSLKSATGYWATSEIQKENDREDIYFLLFFLRNIERCRTLVIYQLPRYIEKSKSCRLSRVVKRIIHAD